MSVVADDLVRIATVEKARGYWATVFRRLSRDPVSMVCATIILLIALAAIFQRDLPLLQGTILVLALFFVALNLLVDIAQAAIDPRIKRS